MIDEASRDMADTAKRPLEDAGNGAIVEVKRPRTDGEVVVAKPIKEVLASRGSQCIAYNCDLLRLDTSTTCLLARGPKQERPRHFHLPAGSQAHLGPPGPHHVAHRPRSGGFQYEVQP